MQTNSESLGVELLLIIELLLIELLLIELLLIELLLLIRLLPTASSSHGVFFRRLLR